MATPPAARTQVFLCYSPEDAARKNELLKHLTPYQKQGKIDVWSDERSLGGQEIRSETADALARARVAVLLISASFLASKLIADYELPALLKAAETEGVRLLPVLLSHSLDSGTRLDGLQYLNPLARSNEEGLLRWKPISEMSKNQRDRLWVQIGREIERELSREKSDEETDAAMQPPTKEISGEHAQTGASSAQQAEDDQAFAQEYRQKLCEDPLLTRIQVLDMDHALALEEIYVRVQVHREHRFRYTSEPVERSGQDPLSLFYLQQKYLEERERAGMEPAEAVQKHPHCAPVGDPGAGKTTLLKYLTLQCAAGKLAEIADAPLFISLHDFARKSGTSRDLLEYVLEEWERVYHLPRERARGFLDRQLHAGRLLVLLDALDETMIGDESAQAEATYQAIHDAVSDLHRAYPRAPMVVTARKAAYHQHAHLVGFDLFEVVDFLPDQIEAFVKNWFRHDPDEERRGMGEGLLTRLRNNPRIYALAANPLLLGLIAYTYEENNERLPENRADLYKRCVETLLRKWDDKRKIRRAHAIDTDEQERLLPQVAWHFHSQGLRYFSRRELLDQIRAFAEAAGKSTLPADLQKILDEITSDNSLLREQAPGHYGFLHLTPQEYFTARHLAEIHGLDLLLEQLGHPWWEEVILLYAGQARDASPLLAHLLSPAGNGAAPEDIFASKLFLAGRCLAAHALISSIYHFKCFICNG